MLLSPGQALRTQKYSAHIVTSLDLVPQDVPGASTASGTTSDLVPVDTVFSPERKIQFGADAAGKGGQDAGKPMFLALRCTDGEDLLGGVQRVRA